MAMDIETITMAKILLNQGDQEGARSLYLKILEHHSKNGLPVERDVELDSLLGGINSSSAAWSAEQWLQKCESWLQKLTQG